MERWLRPVTDTINRTGVSADWQSMLLLVLVVQHVQLKSTSQVAAEQLRYLMFHRDHDREVLGSPALMAQLHQQVREAPGLPAAGSCMAVLAQLARTAAGRAQLRAEGVLQPVLRQVWAPYTGCVLGYSAAAAEPQSQALLNITLGAQGAHTHCTCAHCCCCCSLLQVPGHA